MQCDSSPNVLMFPRGRCEAVNRGSALEGIKSLGKHSLRSFHVLQWPTFRQTAGNLIRLFQLVKQIWTFSDCYMCKRKTKSPRLLPLPFTFFSVVKSSWCKSQRPLCWGCAECADAGPQGTKTSSCALSEGVGGKDRGKSTGAELSATRYMAASCSPWPDAAAIQWLRIMITPLSRVSFVPSSSFRWLTKNGDEKC